MKLNKENYALIMFDLLEGNLSEADELRVMDQIEGDEFLFREWKLFKSTVLIAEKDVVFTGKSALLKEEKALVTLPMYRKWTTVAASVVLLAGVVVFWPSSNPPQLVDEAIPSEMIEDNPNLTDQYVEQTEQRIVNDISENKTESIGVDAEKRIPKVVRVSIPEDLPKDEKYVYDIQQGYDTPEEEFIAQNATQKDTDGARKQVDERLLELYNDAQLKEQEELRIASVLASKKEEIEEKVLPQLPSENIEPEINLEDIAKKVTPSRRERIVAFVTNKPIQRIATTTAAILVKTRNPKLRVKPDFKSSRPSLNIKFESEGYEVIASLQPFKNRNN